MQFDLLREFVALEKRKKDIDSELKDIVARLRQLTDVLLPQFVANGVASMKIDGRLVYLAQDVCASPVNDRREVIEALKHAGLCQFVAEAYSKRSLRTLVHEVADDVRLRCGREGMLFTEDEVRSALPDTLGAALKISFVYSLRSRKG